MSQQVVILKDVRGYWFDIFAPAADSVDDKTGQAYKGKYTTTAIFAPDSEAGKVATSTFAKVAADEFGPNWKAIVEAIDPKKKCIKQGSHKLDKDGNVQDGFAGMLYLSAKNTVKPIVIDSNLAPIREDNGRIFRGCMVNIKVEISAFTSKNPQVGRMIGAKILGVQYAGEGKAFGSAPPTADGFEAVAGSDAFGDMSADAAALFS